MWQAKDNYLYQKFKFKDFDEAFEFIKKVAEIAKSLNHHPKIINSYNIVELELSTHSAGGVITEKDEELAREIDSLIENKSKGKEMNLKIFTDGGSRGNPGPSATGIVIYDDEEKVIFEEGEYIGETTNNQAEYQAIKKAMEQAAKLEAKRVNVFMDSELIIKQLNGEYKVKNAELLPHYQAIKRLESGFDNVSYTHVLRAKNKEADALVNQALDAQI